jgi:hypothetical protein
MDSVGAQSYCAEVAAQYRDEALLALRDAGIAEQRAEELRQTAGFLLERDY